METSAKIKTVKEKKRRRKKKSCSRRSYTAEPLVRQARIGEHICSPPGCVDVASSSECLRAD